MKKISFLLVFIFVNFNAVSQTKKQDTLHRHKDIDFNYKALIIPASFTIPLNIAKLSIYCSNIPYRFQNTLQKIFGINYLQFYYQF